MGLPFGPHSLSLQVLFLALQVEETLQTCCNCAYRSTNFFVPRPGKLTLTRRSSSSPSTPTTVPTPYSGCRTLRPSIGSACAPRFIADRPNDGVVEVAALFCGARAAGVDIPR